MGKKGARLPQEEGERGGKTLLYLLRGEEKELFSVLGERRRPVSDLSDAPRLYRSA